MTTDITSDFSSEGRASPLEKSSAAGLSALMRFLRTPSLARSVVVLLSGALVLLLVVNFSTFLMIQRTASLNEQVDATWQMRRAARGVLLNVQTAETAQRGFILTGQPGFAAAFEGAKTRNPGLLKTFQEQTEADPVGAASSEALTRISHDKFAEMSGTLALARQGQIGQAVSRVRSGEGKRLMDDLETEIIRVDTWANATLDDRRARSQQAAVTTVTVNAIAGVLILLLGGVIFVLVRRYLQDMAAARVALDSANAGLEDTVRNRTAALVRANEEVQRFAYIVSHDLRSPLVNVMGYTAELEQAGKTIDRHIIQAEAERTVDPEIIAAVREDMPEAIGFIRASTEKMDRLINAILKLSREGRRNLLPETVDMTAMAQKAADAIHHQTGEVGAEVVVEPMPTFESDRLSMEQIVGNLIDNAVKYLDPNRPGRIVVSGRDVPGGWVEYAITDNGRGISERDHERIFELFRRSGRQDRPGEGLGLAFVRNSVRRLGGSIDVVSTLGEGSTFRLKFPKRLILVDAGDAL
ncbi:CHASE3 domain-containing protein [soil metagenome]